MFTGIVEEKGIIKDIKISGVSGQIFIEAAKVLEETRTGDSIAVNGVCLTVSKIGDKYFVADVMAETLRRSGLGTLKSGDHVNLERALQLNGRLGGHIVSGHIDGTGRITCVRAEGNAKWFYIETEESVLNLIVEKGSVAVDGISLTVAEIGDNGFAVSVIPHTAGETAILDKRAGDEVNLENDVVGKYVRKFLCGSTRMGQEERDKRILDFLNS